jgi:SAM-dependent methyltransferase
VLAGREGLNSPAYWDERFTRNWESRGGRLQSALFAAGFAAQGIRFEEEVATVLDLGCGLGDALPVLDSMFPTAKIYYSDLSQVAMSQAARRYGNFAQKWDGTSPVDLVYCSNVVEHVKEIDAFIRQIKDASNKFVVVQAPFEEHHVDGSRISREYPLEEHVRTIDDCFLLDDDEFHWTHTTGRVRWAWPTGEQIFFVGVRQTGKQVSSNLQTHSFFNADTRS